MTVERENQTMRISVAGLLRDFWELRLVVACVWVVSIAAGAVYALSATEWYRAHVVIAQAEGQSPVASGLGQLGGLASLAGISLPSDGASQTSLAVLRSNAMSRSFIEKHGLVPVLMAGVTDPAAGDREAERPAPDAVDAAKYFNDKVRVVAEDRRSGLITVVIRWRDPELAASWANQLVEDANARLREQALREAESSIQYLKSEIATTDVTAMQQSMSRLLEVEMQKLLIAKGNEEFAFRIIDRAVTPRERDSPKRRVVVAGSLLAGLFVSLLLVSAYRIRRELRSAR